MQNEEKEYVFYFDLYKLEGNDVFNAFKNAIDKELGYKNIKYTLKQANVNTILEDDTPNVMKGGDSNATFPYNVFENSIDSITGVAEEERKSIFEGLFTRNKNTEEVSKPSNETSSTITSEEPSIEPKKKGFFNFDFSVINIFKKSENVDIKPTINVDTEDKKEDTEVQEEKEEEEKENEEKENEDGDDEEGDAEDGDAEDGDEGDVSQELIEGSEIVEENKINNNIITVELTIKCIDKQLCIPVILDIKKTMFMK